MLNPIGRIRALVGAAHHYSIADGTRTYVTSLEVLGIGLL